MYSYHVSHTLWVYFYSAKEAYYERELILADRDLVETDSDAILQDAAEVDVSLLVVGDPFGCASCSFQRTVTRSY